MSGFHNNANWIAPNIIEYERFNSQYKYIYCTPTGKLLECYTWKDGSLPTEEARKEAQIEALKIVDQMQVMPLKRTFTGKPADNPSPSVRIIGYEYDMQQSMAMYFMEHGGDCSELDAKVRKKHPATEEDTTNAMRFIVSDPGTDDTFNYELCQPIPKEIEIS